MSEQVKQEPRPLSQGGHGHIVTWEGDGGPWNDPPSLRPPSDGLDGLTGVAGLCSGPGWDVAVALGRPVWMGSGRFELQVPQRREGHKSPKGLTGVHKSALARAIPNGMEVGFRVRL